MSVLVSTIHCDHDREHFIVTYCTVHPGFHSAWYESTATSYTWAWSSDLRGCVIHGMLTAPGARWPTIAWSRHRSSGTLGASFLGTYEIRRYASRQRPILLQRSYIVMAASENRSFPRVWLWNSGFSWPHMVTLLISSIFPPIWGVLLKLYILLHPYTGVLSQTLFLSRSDRAWLPNFFPTAHIRRARWKFLLFPSYIR